MMRISTKALKGAFKQHMAKQTAVRTQKSKAALYARKKEKSHNPHADFGTIQRGRPDR